MNTFSLLNHAWDMLKERVIAIQRYISYIYLKLFYIIIDKNGVIKNIFEKYSHSIFEADTMKYLGKQGVWK